MDGVLGGEELELGDHRGLGKGDDEIYSASGGSGERRIVPFCVEIAVHGLRRRLGGRVGRDAWTLCSSGSELHARARVEHDLADLEAVVLVSAVAVDAAHGGELQIELGAHRRRRGREGSYWQLRPRREPYIAAASVRAGRAGPTMIAEEVQLFHARGDPIDSMPFMLQANLVQAVNPQATPVPDLNP